MRPAALALVAVMLSTSSAAAGLGDQAARLVAPGPGYREVVRAMLAWHRTRTHGCVAFVTTALAQVGYEIPDQRLDGPWSNPARVTFALDAWLADDGWARIEDARALVAGDLVFTTGAPDHVMLFHGWADRRAEVAWVSDNQRHRYRRPLRPDAGSRWSAFGFARRAPADARGVVDVDDAPACADVSGLRRAAGRAFAGSSEVTCRAAPGGAVALVRTGGVEVVAARLLVLDRGGRVRARRALPASIDGHGGTDLPALGGAADLDGDGRLEVWVARQWSSPLGSSRGEAIELYRVRGGGLVALGQVDGGWRRTWVEPATAAGAGGEHWEPEVDDAHAVTCTATVTAEAGGLAVRRALTVGGAVPAGVEHEACVALERLPGGRRQRRGSERGARLHPAWRRPVTFRPGARSGGRSRRRGGGGSGSRRCRSPGRPRR